MNHPEVGYFEKKSANHPLDFISYVCKQEPSPAFVVEEGVASPRDVDWKIYCQSGCRRVVKHTCAHMCMIIPMHAEMDRRTIVCTVCIYIL